MIWCGRSLLKSPIRYGLCLSQNDFDIALIKMGMEPERWLERGDAAVTHFYTSTENKVRVIVCIRPKRGAIENTYATLVHEAVHVWQEIRDYIGEARAGNEQEAYCIEQIAHNLMTAYKAYIRSHK